MVVLGIDSSARSASAALVKDGCLIAEMFLNVGLTHSSTLLPLIKQCLEQGGVKISELSAIAVSKGPGSFTGVRIGVATVKGLAFAHDIPCVGVSTLEAIAYPLLGGECTAAAVMDARCRQVYSALFDCSADKMTRISEDGAISFEQLAESLSGLNKRAVLIGDGASVAAQYLSEQGVEHTVANHIFVHQRASSVAFIGERSLKEENTVSADELAPMYLRMSQAERELKKRENLQ